MRLQVPLYKLFLIPVVWAVALGVFSLLGTIGWVIAGVTATAGSFLVIAIREKRDVVECVNVVLGSAIGVYLVNILLFSSYHHHYDYDAFRHWVFSSLGAIIGALMASQSRRKSRKTEQ